MYIELIPEYRVPHRNCVILYIGETGALSNQDYILCTDVCRVIYSSIYAFYLNNRSRFAIACDATI